MKRLSKVALIVTALIISAGTYAHWGNSDDNTQNQNMRNASQNSQSMQNWREHMGNNPEEHYQWMERMHKQFFNSEQVAMRESCPGMNGNRGRGMGWFNQSENNEDKK